jgi:sulfur-carrier protein adenylyltransferase/sulfurtransferase
VSPALARVAPRPAAAGAFSYDDAFSRNIGWITEAEQLRLRGKRVAIAGMGGVGGVHLLTLARLGIGAFTIADFDRFEMVNVNRQVGATMSTLGLPKVDVLEGMAREVNPELDIRTFREGVTETNIDAFLRGADLFIDGFDFFVLDMRARVFQRCAELGIPALTAGPIGIGAAWIVFMPGRMTFEDYFRLSGLPIERQYANFFVGLVPKALQRPYLLDPTKLDLAAKRGPSSMTACQLCAGVAGTEALKILLGRGRVRAAPWYHQFDAYRGKYVVRRMPGGNANPLQRLKLRAVYRQVEAMARKPRPEPVRLPQTPIETILDMARWAPSGDNTQPWRFRITGSDRVRLRILDSEDDIYDFEGRPTLISTGCLIENLRIAAAELGRAFSWSYEPVTDGGRVLNLAFPKDPGTQRDPLHPYLPLRSVDRRAYRLRPLDHDDRRALEAAIDPEFDLIWHESAAERWRMSRINGLASDLRLKIPEAFRVHQRVIDWERRFSPTGIPAGAVGLDRLTLKIMRWGLADWSRMRRLNRPPGSTLMARLQMDYEPGYFSAAHFTIARRAPAAEDGEPGELLRLGQSLQRFWLAATARGISLQPTMAPIIFAYYGRRAIPFTAEPSALDKARHLDRKLAAATGRPSEFLLFRGRIGHRKERPLGPRSIRRPLSELIES